MFFNPLYQLRSATPNVSFCSKTSQDTIKLTNLKVVLVGQAVNDRLDLGCLCQNLLAHLVHGVLHAGRVLLCKRLHGDCPGIRVCFVENGLLLLHLLEAAKLVPLPCRLDLCAENAVPRLRQTGELVAVEAVECRARRLEHKQLLDSTLDADALALAEDGLDGADLGAVAEERVRVWLALDLHARPAVHNDLDVAGVDVRVSRDKVVSEDGGKDLGHRDVVLLGHDVDRLLLRVGCYYRAVVCLGVSAPG